MNKRIKIKKGILHKKCNENCMVYKSICDLSLITNNCCNGCKLSDCDVILNLLKENEDNNTTYKRISRRQAGRVIEERKPLGLFWTKEGDWYTAIDNNTGDAWTECFKTKEECFEYLDGNDLCQCFSPD